MIDANVLVVIGILINLAALAVGYLRLKSANESARADNERARVDFDRKVIEMSVRVDTLWQFFIHDATGAAARAGIVGNPDGQVTSTWRTMTRDSGIDKRIAASIAANSREGMSGAQVTAQTLADLEKELIALAAKHRIRPSAMIGIVAVLVNAQSFSGGWIRNDQ